MFGLSVTELLVILAIVLLLFGTRKLRNLGGDLGGAIKGFRKAMKDDDSPQEKPYLEGEREDSDLNRTTTGTQREQEEDRQQR